ncbi:MAG: methylmalonyl Co-A mutase-associated GTPase MeaB [Deltaproteobacteria bacterium]|nr:methylmalonyl Co-A mutase-associated GTPase MeaB [Deltaproteobacteria bacterium]
MSSSPANAPSPAAPDLDAFVARVLAGEQRAGARAMRLVDDRAPVAAELLRRLHPHTGKALVVGITGNPGSGKSTLTDQLVRAYRARGSKVAVVAVDPSSPFSGGAILGDRIRMSAHATDPDVFIRSVATRGHLGGLSASTFDVVQVLDAMGYSPIFLETVGVGQDEIDVVRVAHTSVVVLVPGLGDDIQAIKAGILEIADVFVVNKADRDGIERTIKDIRGLQALAAGVEGAWTPPVVRTIATRGDGVDEVIAAVEAHAAFAEASSYARDRARLRMAHVLESVVIGRLRERYAAALGDEATATARLDALLARDRDLYAEADALLAQVLADGARTDGEEEA